SFATRSATATAASGIVSSLHCAGRIPRVRGAAFFGVLRRTGARLRLDAVFAAAGIALSSPDRPRRKPGVRAHPRLGTYQELVHLGSVHDTGDCARPHARAAFPERRCAMTDGALRSSFEDLRNDLQAVARDAEALLKATAEVGGERIE